MRGNLTSHNVLEYIQSAIRSDSMPVPQVKVDGFVILKGQLTLGTMEALASA